MDRRGTVVNPLYSKTWLHNDRDKPHTYYTTSMPWTRKQSMPANQDFFRTFGSYTKTTCHTNAGSFKPGLHNVELKRHTPSIDASNPFQTTYHRATTGLMTQNPAGLKEA